MLDRSTELIEVMAQKSPSELEALMSISPRLAEINFERFQDWEPPFRLENSRQALLAFNGDTYTGIDARDSFTERDYTHSQKTLRILSGLYGVLRPLDLIQPYRLEMGSKLPTPRGNDLYTFWADRITDQLKDDLKSSPGAKVLVNCASNEYFNSVDTDQLNAKVITPSFLDSKDGAPHRMVSFFAKRARGAFAGWLIRNRVKSVNVFPKFDLLGYVFDPERSTSESPVFLRS